MIQNSRSRGPDEIDEVLGSPHYLTPYYDKALRDAILGPHARDLVPVTRYYPSLKPPVVVDFEPQHDKFFVDQKRHHFMVLGVVYIPVFLGERLTKEQFAERVKREREITKVGNRQLADDLLLETVEVDHLFEDPDLHAAIKREALVRLEKLEKLTLKNKFYPKFRGFARTKKLEKLVAEVTDEFREQVRHGGVGRILSHLQPPNPAGGLGHG
jgi:hypothetical protein